MFRSPIGRRAAALVAAATVLVLSTGVVSAHEARTVAGYDMEVGFISEPVFVGERSGLEFFVHKEDKPITGLEQTLKADVTYQGQKRDLPITARDGVDGAYESVFIPTAAGPYTFHIVGTIEGAAIDESFTSSPTGFDEVHDTAGGQFPVQFPSEADLVANAQAGKDAAAQVTVALCVGIAGVVIGLIGLGVALSGRRRPA